MGLGWLASYVFEWPVWNQTGSSVIALPEVATFNILGPEGCWNVVQQDPKNVEDGTPGQSADAALAAEPWRPRERRQWKQLDRREDLNDLRLYGPTAAKPHSPIAPQPHSPTAP
jgi:hypothetical protein